MKLVVEPTGCLGFAAAREHKFQLQGKRIGVLISGGNVDLQLLATRSADEESQRG
jgi:threonine dehydratase